MKVATHDGSFHADDVFAVATLRLAFGGDVEVVRTRDPERLAEADIRVDVGMRFDPTSGDFDHHQRGGAGERRNGVRYASFGLVWNYYGPRVCGSRDVAFRVDHILVQGIDALDNGQTITRSLLSDGTSEISMGALIGAFNPAWDEERSEDEAFAEAVEFAVGILEREIASCKALLRAEREVRRCLDEQKGSPVLVLERNMPWRRVVVEEAPWVRYVLYPKSDGWGVQAVPQRMGEFENRLDLPSEWAGLTGEELARASGVPDAFFCHTARFFAVCRSREGALALAEAALGTAGIRTEGPAEGRRLHGDAARA